MYFSLYIYMSSWREAFSKKVYIIHFPFFTLHFFSVISFGTYYSFFAVYTILFQFRLLNVSYCGKVAPFLSRCVYSSSSSKAEVSIDCKQLLGWYCSPFDWWPHGKHSIWYGRPFFLGHNHLFHWYLCIFQHKDSCLRGQLRFVWVEACLHLLLLP